MKACFDEEAEEEYVDYNLADTEDENEEEDCDTHANDEVKTHLKKSH